MRKALSFILFLTILCVASLASACLVLVNGPTASPFSDVPVSNALFSDSPVSEVPAETPQPPSVEDYNEHDYKKLLAFLESADESGVKIGELLSADYDPSLPFFGIGAPRFERCFSWTETEDGLRLSGFDCSHTGFGSVDLSGCTALKKLRVSSGRSIRSIDISGCTALEELNCSYCNLTELDLSGCPNLFRLRCNSNPLKTLDLSACPKLCYIYCSDCELTELDVSFCKTLGVLFCDSNALTELKLPPEAKNLDALSFTDNKIKEIDLSFYKNLFMLDCSYNELTSLDVSGCKNLLRLFCSGNPVGTLDVSALEKLERLSCSSCGLTELDISNCKRLSGFNASFNALTKLDLPTGGASLFAFDCRGNALTQLDLAYHIKLTEFRCEGNEFTELDLSKNPFISFSLLCAEGGGTISFNSSCLDILDEEGDRLNRDSIYTEAVFAAPLSGHAFVGWFDENGALVSAEAEYRFDKSTPAVLIARFKAE